MGPSDYEIENAIIGSWRFEMEHGLSIWLQLEYECGGQGFGGFALYIPGKSGDANYGGHYIWRLLEVAGVKDLRDLPGKAVRADHKFDHVRAIGHIVKDDWFRPKEEFAELKEAP